VTGELSFLPLHAAGTFKGVTVKCLSDFAVSSYIPTLLTLNKARRDWVAIPRADVTGVLLGEPAAPDPGAARLPGVTEEVDLVRQCFEAAHAQVVNTPSEHTTCGQMRSLLTGHSTHILHLASHGTQARDPLRSAFLLHDGRFSIEDIRSLELPHAVLAFLSACETAKGDRHAPDQAVHLAASMLFCGFRSVIGTMW
jgi:CHAT domain-containing protein